MSRVEITLGVEYLKCELAPDAYEWDPRLMVYLTGHFSIDRIAQHLPLVMGAPSRQTTLRGQRPLLAGDIPATAAIVFASTCKHRNSSGIPVAVDAGTSHIMLSELVTHDWRDGQPFVKDIPLLMHTAKNFEKGIVRITVQHADHVNLGTLHVSAMHIDGPAAGKSIMAYMNRVMQQEQRMGNTLSNTDNVRCPFDFSQAGWQLTGIPMPAQGFVLNPEQSKSNAFFWENNYENAMRCFGLKPSDWRTLPPQEKVAMTLRMIVRPAQALPYISDRIDRNRRNTNAAYDPALKVGMENFYNSMTLGGGDCEDGGKSNMQVDAAFLAFDHSTSQKYASVFAEMKRALDQYVPVLSLEVVHGAKAADHTESYGAHMSVNVFPAPYFKAMMERTVEGKQLSRRLPWPANMDDTLEVQLMEGTGMLDPRGYKDGLKQVHAYIAQYLSPLGVKLPLIFEHGKPSSFFVSSKQGWTPYFSLRGMTDGSADGFWYTTQPAGTRGALYDDFINKRGNVGVRPMPRMDDADRELMMEAVQFRPPAEPLMLTKRRTVRRSTHLDSLVKQVAQLNRTASDARPSVEVSAYLCPHQLDEHVVEKLVGKFTEMSRVSEVSYECEDITDRMHGWRLMIRVHVDQLDSQNAINDM